MFGSCLKVCLQKLRDRTILTETRECFCGHDELFYEFESARFSVFGLSFTPTRPAFTGDFTPSSWANPQILPAR
jgi:hypothetical protein